MLVGVRYSITGDPVPHDKDRHALLKEVWPGGIIVDVNDDPNTQADLCAISTRKSQPSIPRRNTVEALQKRLLSAPCPEEGIFSMPASWPERC